MGEQEVQALEEGAAFVDLTPWRKVLVRGEDGTRWLNDLVTASVEQVAPQTAVRTLLLDRAGHIRADFHVARVDDGLLLVQDPEQPRAVDALLSPYVLSSRVDLEDVTRDLCLIALPGESEPPDPWAVPASLWRPSVLGPGADIHAPASEREAVRRLLGDRREVGLEHVETWRIRRGRPRFGVDFDDRSIPAEAGLDDLIDTGKGCFLGQESVAKVRNLGDPPWILRAFDVPERPRAGDGVFLEGREVGRLTSVAPQRSGGATVIARVRREAAGRELSAAPA